MDGRTDGWTDGWLEVTKPGTEGGWQPQLALSETTLCARARRCVSFFFWLILGSNLCLPLKRDVGQTSPPPTPACSGMSFISNWCYFVPSLARQRCGDSCVTRACSCFRQARLAGPPSRLPSAFIQRSDTNLLKCLCIFLNRAFFCSLA